MTEFLLRPASVRDLRKAYHWYEAERQGLGEEFLRAVRICVDKVLSVPRGYAIIHRDTRRALVPKFPYGIFFRIVGETVVIVACYHLHRRPAPWKRRR